jgi:PDZ domain-containing protein
MSSRTYPKVLALIAAGVALLVACALYLLRTPSDVIVLNPDHANPASKVVRVAGAPRQPAGRDHGIYYLDVLVHRASLAESWLVRFERGATTVSARAYLPPGGERQERRIDRAAIQESKKVAGYVALRALGKPVRLTGGGVRIGTVTFRAARQAGVRPGQVITAVDGRPVHTLEDLQTILARHGPGQVVAVEVRRRGGTRVLHVPLHADPAVPGRPLIGVTVSQVPYHIRLPLAVTIDTGNLGGPSAGLAFALQIYDALEHGKLTRQRRVAVTGTIALNGGVGPIGGMRQKAISARDAKADILLVPPQNAAEARRYAGGVPVVAVSSFRQALDALRRGKA